jgi:hypothetical protein
MATPQAAVDPLGPDHPRYKKVIDAKSIHPGVIGLRGLQHRLQSSIGSAAHAIRVSLMSALFLSTSYFAGRFGSVPLQTCCPMLNDTEFVLPYFIRTGGTPTGFDL